MQSHSRGIELCHGPGEVTFGKPEVPEKTEVIRKTAIRLKLAQNAFTGVTIDGEDNNVIGFELRPRISGQTGSYRFRAHKRPIVALLKSARPLLQG